MRASKTLLQRRTPKSDLESLCGNRGSCQVFCLETKLGTCFSNKIGATIIVAFIFCTNLRKKDNSRRFFQLRFSEGFDLSL